MIRRSARRERKREGGGKGEYEESQKPFGEDEKATRGWIEKSASHAGISDRNPKEKKRKREKKKKVTKNRKEERSKQERRRISCLAMA